MKSTYFLLVPVFYFLWFNDDDILIIPQSKTKVNNPTDKKRLEVLASNLYSDAYEQKTRMNILKKST